MKQFWSEFGSVHARRVAHLSDVQLWCPGGLAVPHRQGRVAAQYHTARFRFVPSLAKALNVPTPAERKPGSAWIELPRSHTACAEAAGHVRIGYARASTARQSLDTQKAFHDLLEVTMHLSHIAGLPKGTRSNWTPTRGPNQDSPARRQADVKAAFADPP